MTLYIVLSATYVLVLKVTCFILGYLIVKIGASLLRDGIKGEFKFKAEMSGVKGDLASASPGLLFLLVGAVLIGYAMWVPKPSELRVEDQVPVQNPTAPPNVPIR